MLRKYTMHAVFHAFLCHVAVSDSPDYLRASLQLRSLSKNARDWLNLEERYKIIFVRYGWWCEAGLRGGGGRTFSGGVGRFPYSTVGYI